MGKDELREDLAFLGRAATSGFDAGARWLGWLEKRVMLGLFAKGLFSGVVGFVVSLLGRDNDPGFRWLLGLSAAAGTALLLWLYGAVVENRKAREETPSKYLKRLQFGAETLKVTEQQIGVEIAVKNRSGFRVTLHVDRERILLSHVYNGAAKVEVSRQIENGEDGYIRVMIPKADADKEIDIEDLKIRARISAEKGRIVCDVVLPMPMRQAFIFSPIIGGGYQLGHALY